MTQSITHEPTTRMTEVDGLAVQIDGPEKESARGTILVVAPFGVSADSLFMPAYVLARNGFRVVRFDPRNHVGHSPGTIYDFRVSTVVEDVHRLLPWAEPDLLIGFSLAGPPAYRALREWGRPLPAIFAAPVVSMRYTLNAVLEADYFEVDPGDHKVVLGETVHGRQFIGDCREHRMVDYEDSLADLAEVPGELVLVAGTDDPWVSAEQVHGVVTHREAAPGAGPTEVVPVAVGTHQFNLNPTIAMTYTRVILAHALRITGGDPQDGQVPALDEIITARRKVAAQAAQARAMAAGKDAR